MKTWRSVLAMAVLLALMPLRADAQPEVSIDLYTFDPPILEVGHGERIRWVNNESLGVPHNVIITNSITPEGELIFDTDIICGAMVPGESCRPTTAKISELLPPGTHFLTCTIDQEHALLMHQVVIVG